MIPDNEFTNPYINDDNEKGYDKEVIEFLEILTILSSQLLPKNENGDL